MSEYDVDVAILGAGTAGMGAYREATKQTDRIALIDGGPLGTTCARVGCMPSKLLIAAANVAQAMRDTDRFGIYGEAPRIDGAAVMQRLRDERDRFVGFVLDTVEEYPDRHLIRENATFINNHTLKLSGGGTLTARAIVIATGSRANVAGPLEGAGDRLMTSADERDKQRQELLQLSRQVGGASEHDVMNLQNGSETAGLHAFNSANSVSRKAALSIYRHLGIEAEIPRTQCSPALIAG